jgi:3-methyladenine DNA glycosylase AlkC
MSEALRKIKEAERDLVIYKRELLAELLNQCTFEQQTIFIKMYESVTNIAESSIEWAIKQCERTIELNKQKEL